MKTAVLLGASALAVLVASAEVRAEDQLTLGYMMAKSGPYVSLANTNEVAVDMARRIPNAKLVRLERCGHLSNLERPEAFDAAIRAFLRD